PMTMAVSEESGSFCSVVEETEGVDGASEDVIFLPLPLFRERKRSGQDTLGRTLSAAGGTGGRDLGHIARAVKASDSWTAWWGCGEILASDTLPPEALCANAGETPNTPTAPTRSATSGRTRREAEPAHRRARLFAQHIRRHEVRAASHAFAFASRQPPTWD